MVKEINVMLSFLQRQLNSFWDTDLQNYPGIQEKIAVALKKVDTGWGASSAKYYVEAGFSPYNSAEYTVFLYYLSHEIGKDSGGGILADKIYYLNKIMNGVDWYWPIELPEHFIVEHPVGSVLGKAKYGDHLCIYQGVTIGGNRRTGELFYPKLGDYVTMYANATVLGNSRIGHHVVVSANTFIIDTDIPDCSVVFGGRSSLGVKHYDLEEMERRYFSIWTTNQQREE